MDVSLSQVVYGELMAVTAAMRKNSRWAAYQHMPTSRRAPLAATMGIRRPPAGPDAARHDEEFELIAAFEELKREIKETATPIREYDVAHILSPFLELIRSPLSTGPITTAALTALHNLVTARLLAPDAPGIGPALAYLSHVVSHCKFETTDHASDEIVLLNIISLVSECIRGPLGPLFGDAEICEMLETVLTTSCHTRLSELLRRSTESHLRDIVRAMFARLKTLNPESEERRLNQDGSTPNPDQTLASQAKSVASTPVDETVLEDKTPIGEHPSLPTEETTPVASSSTHALVATEPPRPTAPTVPYGLPAIIELFRAIIDLLDPNTQRHTDSARLVALRALNVAVEVAGTTLAVFPSLCTMVVDNGCRYLFQLARSVNPYILFTSLRVIAALFDTMPEHLKLQRELFLSFSIERLAPPPRASTLPAPGTPQQRKGSTMNNNSTASLPGTPSFSDAGSERAATPASKPNVAPAKGETRELTLETLLLLTRNPSFMVDLWANYDSDVNCEDLFEKFVTFLCKSVYPTSAMPGAEARQQPSQFQCLNALLVFINHMAARVDGAYDEWPSNFVPIETLRTNKSQKRILVTAAAKFNVKPKDGLAYLADHGLLGPLNDQGKPLPVNVATFMKNSPRLGKKLLGDYISRPENLDILTAYLHLFDFTGKHIADAMRELLETFRLPGEAQQISRITETFAEVYFATGPEHIKTQDAVYILSYSVLLLNTDQHNPQNRKRMTVEDYQRNLRGVDGGADFDPEFLRAIYDTIRKREIVMPEEHTGQVGFDYAWKELLGRAQQAGKYMSCNTNVFDAAMFKIVWKQVISAIAFSLSSCDDDETIQRAVGGFRQCASLAGAFGLPEVFDFIAGTLSQATGLVNVEGDVDRKGMNNPVVEVEGQNVTVSRLSIEFGTNIRGQLAAVVLFTVANSNADSIREGWEQIFEVFQNLFLHQLLPTRMLQMEDFLGGVSIIPLQVPSAPSRPQPRSDAGLLSTLSSYLLTPYSASSEALVLEATEAEVESTMSTIDCINACRLDELYAKILSLESEALLAALRALQNLAAQRTSERLRELKADDDLPSPLPYDPASIFLLETMVSISVHRADSIEEIWPIAFEHLSSLLSMAQNYSMLLIERAVVGLLRLCLIIAPKPALRDQLYVALDLLGGLNPEVTNAVAEQTISGLALVVKGHYGSIRSTTEWSLVFAPIRAVVGHPEASKSAFELVEHMVLSKEVTIVTAENLAGFVALLDEFASTAGQFVEAHAPKTRGKAQPQSQSSEPAVERGVKAVDLLYSLKGRAVSLQAEDPQTPLHAWRRYQLPLLASLGRQCINPCREVRDSAIAHLQRAIVSQKVEDNVIVGDIFNRVVFPLLDELLRPQVFQRDPHGMPATRSAAAALLAKTFLEFETQPKTRSVDVRVLWIQILDLFDRLMNIDRRDQLYESVPETLKNVLLVMHASGILLPPPPQGVEDTRDQVEANLWGATHERLDRFLPGFLDDIIVVSDAGYSLPAPPAHTGLSVPPTPIVANSPAAQESSSSLA